MSLIMAQDGDKMNQSGGAIKGISFLGKDNLYILKNII